MNFAVSTVKVIYTHEIPNNLLLQDVVGMGPTRPTWEQARAADFVIEVRNDGSLIAHNVLAAFGWGVDPILNAVSN